MPEREPIDWEEALRLHRSGWTFADIAREFGYAYKSVLTKLRSMGAPPRRPSWRRRTKLGSSLLDVWSYTRKKYTVPSHPAFPRYGAKGVRICREWEGSFDAFHDWAVSNGYRPGLRLARKDRSRGYSPGNCRWVTLAEQLRRRRRPEVRPPSWMLTAFGETKGRVAWARDPRCRVSPTTLWRRLRRGDPPEEAITAPPGATRKPGVEDASPRPRRKRIDWDEAKRLYLEMGLSRAEVAQRVGASYHGTSKAFRRLGIRRRDGSGPTSTPEGKRLHNTWLSLHRRCSVPADALYPYTGAKGIGVSSEWAEFPPFLAWALESGAKPGLCLTRLDVRKDYSPTNCAWVTRAEISRQPPSRPTPARRPIAAFGEVKGLAAWSKDPRCSVSTTTISRRLAMRWAAESAIAEPAENPGAGDVMFTELTAFGVTKGITDWTRDRRCKVSLTGIKDRLRRGWSAEDAIATLPFRKPRSR